MKVCHLEIKSELIPVVVSTPSVRCYFYKNEKGAFSEYLIQNATSKIHQAFIQLQLT